MKKQKTKKNMFFMHQMYNLVPTTLNVTQASNLFWHQTIFLLENKYSFKGLYSQSVKYLHHFQTYV